jgi:hypothetical protein
MQQLEHDDMASEYSSVKPAATERKPLGSKQAPSPQQPQIQPPLLSDGPESLRDTNC